MTSLVNILKRVATSLSAKLVVVKTVVDQREKPSNQSRTLYVWNMCSTDGPWPMADEPIDYGYKMAGKGTVTTRSMHEIDTAIVKVNLSPFLCQATCPSIHPHSALAPAERTNSDPPPKAGQAATAMARMMMKVKNLSAANPSLDPQGQRAWTPRAQELGPPEPKSLDPQAQELGPPGPKSLDPQGRM